MTKIFSLQDLSQSPNLELFSSLKSRVDQASFLPAMDVTVVEKRLMGRALNENEGPKETHYPVDAVHLCLNQINN